MALKRRKRVNLSEVKSVLIRPAGRVFCWFARLTVLFASWYKVRRAGSAGYGYLEEKITIFRRRGK